MFKEYEMDRERFIYKKFWNLPWLLLMAWRDSRRNRFRLILFISSIVLGIAALVTTFSLGANVRKDIDRQARTLVGADLVVESNHPMDSAVRKKLDAIGLKRSHECSFASMVYFTKNQGSRLVQVRALDGEYPFYGKLETSPANAAIRFRNEMDALVDKTLSLQFDVLVGDSIKIGDLVFRIAGILSKSPGRNGLSTTIAPPVYIPYRYLPMTGLMKKGSRILYSFYFQFGQDNDMSTTVAQLGPWLDREGLDYETVDSRKRRTGRAFEDFNQFLTLISFIALLLGCIGVASSIHIYMRDKINSIAILRCLGTSGSQSFLIYLLQTAGIGLLGSIAGAFLGVLVQQFLPSILKDILPIELSTTVSWISVFIGIFLGLAISVLFALLSLVSIRNISPLYTLRMTVEQVSRLRDPLRWLIYLIILTFVLLFAQWQMKNWKHSIVFTGSVIAGFLILAGMGKALQWALRRFFPSSWNYLWRQGFANLYRPNNQTLILLTTIGLGAAFIGTLYFVHGILLNQVAVSGSGKQPNMVLFDIQPSQKAEVANLARQFHLPLIQQLPIVTMRVESVNGKTAADIGKDSGSRFSRRAFESELRVTYRDSLTDSEKLIEGKLKDPKHDPAESVNISVEDQWAHFAHWKIGDHIIFNVQGMLVPTIVGSLRQVDWRRMQTNFRVIFPTGVLEGAPQFHVLITRVPSAESSAQFQRAIVHQFPNISIIDLGLILSVLDDVLDKIGFVIKFMAAFSIFTGVVVLIASVVISKFQRIQETVLLRTLGASRKQILSITALEYFFLGALAAAVGILLAMAASFGLAKFIFEAPFAPSWLPILVLFFSICILTILIGLFNSREVLQKPPLEILRTEI